MPRADRLLNAFSVRPCAQADVPLLVRWLSDDVVRAAVEDEDRDPLSRKYFLSKLVRSTPQRDAQGGFMVTCQDQPVGFIHLMWINWISRTTEVDLLIDPQCRSRIAGFMTIQKAGEIAFEHLNLNKIYGFIYDSNARSLSPLRRVLTIEATMAGAAIRDGAHTDVHIGSITADGYRRTKESLRVRRPAECG